MTQTLIRGGTVFDGSGGEGVKTNVLIKDDKIAAIGAEVDADNATEVDASGCWVMPGFVDNHTHYDAELEIAPSLSESVRHGVTSVLVGSCGLGMALGKPSDLADMFCRVEGIPRDVVLPLLERIKDWNTAPEYLEHLERLPLGPNVMVMLGHSTVRAAVLGLGRSLESIKPTRDEIQKMENVLHGALDAGYLGLSINTLPWDKMDGDEFRSRPTPSVFAGWSEYRAFTRILRARRRIFQGVPNISTKLNLLLFFLESAGVFRPGLKTAMISMVDAKATRWSFRAAGFMAQITNKLLGGNTVFQSLPNVFDLYVDGMEVPVFEEFGAGTEALHLKERVDRSRLLQDAAYRKRFKRNWYNKIYGRAYHRNLDEARIVGCPDATLVGQTFGDLARQRKQNPVDCLLDLLAEHDTDLRWYTVVGNDRPRWLRWIAKHSAAQMGFSDAGAHLRNMAFYNFPLKLLRMVKEDNEGFMTTGEAVRRLTAEIADWLQVDAGHLAEGRRADVVVINPQGLNADIDAVHEDAMPGFEGMSRLVRRNDSAVRSVFVAGRPAWHNGALMPELGQQQGFGRVLRAIA